MALLLLPRMRLHLLQGQEHVLFGANVKVLQHVSLPRSFLTYEQKSCCIILVASPLDGNLVEAFLHRSLTMEQECVCTRWRGIAGKKLAFA
jgi:hypothetical protein